VRGCVDASPIRGHAADGIFHIFGRVEAYGGPGSPIVGRLEPERSQSHSVALCYTFAHERFHTETICWAVRGCSRRGLAFARVRAGVQFWTVGSVPF
jgi:hypothetical protein